MSPRLHTSGEREVGCVTRSIMLVGPWLNLSEEPSTLFVAKLFISAIGFIVLCLGARLYLLARKRERSDCGKSRVEG